MHWFTSTAYRLKTGRTELLAGIILIALSTVLLPYGDLGDILLQIVIFSIIPIMQISPLMAILPMFIAAGLWTTNIADNLLLSGPLTYIAVQYAAFCGSRIITATLAIQWLALGYGVALGEFPGSDHIATIVFEIVLLTMAITIGISRRLVLRTRRRMISREQLERELQENIARYLHDSLARNLTTISMQTELARMDIPPSSAHHQLNQVAHSARTAMEDLHQLVNHLLDHKTQTASTSLGKWNAPSIGEAIVTNTKLLRESGYQVSVDDIDTQQRHPREIETAFYLALSEVTTNVVKHSLPRSKVNISTNHMDEMLSILVRNSIASPSRAAEMQQGGLGLGLHNIQERMSAIGGSAIIEPSTDFWEITLNLPISNRGRKRPCSKP